MKSIPVKVKRHSKGYSSSSSPSYLLVVNAGSSSIKVAVFENSKSSALKLQALASLQGKNWDISWKSSLDLLQKDNGPQEKEKIKNTGGYASCFLHLLESIEKKHKLPLAAAGHRVVHAGNLFSRHIKINAQVIKKLEKIIPLAPLHQPQNIGAIKLLKKRYPKLDQFACFDSVFHNTIPSLAYSLPLPKKLREKGLRRYGFHGLSYQYISLQLKAMGLEKKKSIIAHLGNGASLAALRNGRSIETSMGFSALDGLVMGSRAGQLDPGVLLYLLKEEKMNHQSLENLLYRESGLLALSGISNDVRDLLQSSEPSSQEALDIFLYRIQQYIGNFAAVLEGFDVLVFSGGIGERAWKLRLALCKKLSWLGLKLDKKKNRQFTNEISSLHSKESRVKVFIIPSNEEWMIAYQLKKLLKK